MSSRRREQRQGSLNVRALTLIDELFLIFNAPFHLLRLPLLFHTSFRQSFYQPLREPFAPFTIFPRFARFACGFDCTFDRSSFPTSLPPLYDQLTKLHARSMPYHDRSRVYPCESECECTRGGESNGCIRDQGLFELGFVLSVLQSPACNLCPLGSVLLRFVSAVGSSLSEVN